MLLLASASETRLAMLRAAGLTVDALPARVDEDEVRRGLEAEGASSRDVADALAELKAAKISARRPEALVLGADQVLDLGGKIYAKPESPEQARQQLQELRGRTHMLLSAAVLYQGGQPQWRHVGVARLTMRDVSDSYLDDYLARNWETIRHSVGGYRLEEEGVRLFSAISGDHFTILGLPLLPLLSNLSERGIIPA
ncbi:Maf family protein [Xinfangfangia pollutisoli]|uniref:Maf family protein n=1 Tax=Xinfangfangia pollutisoli TaxID=2865960 RepID=UPI001CD350AA|nr:Maf family protein [Xinfangfangia pollutisoli]